MNAKKPTPPPPGLTVPGPPQVTEAEIMHAAAQGALSFLPGQAGKIWTVKVFEACPYARGVFREAWKGGFYKAACYHFSQEIFPEWMEVADSLDSQLVHAMCRIEDLEAASPSWKSTTTDERPADGAIVVVIHVGYERSASSFPVEDFHVGRFDAGLDGYLDTDSKLIAYHNNFTHWFDLGPVTIEQIESGFGETAARSIVSEQPKCSACAHWRFEADDMEREEVEARPCHCPLMTADDGPFLEGELGERRRPVGGAQCHIDYPVAQLWTGPRFGCIHFEARANG